MFTAFNSSIARAVLGTVGTALCAGICLVPATAPASAAPAAANEPTTRSMIVSAADLNLGSVAGRKALDRRIVHAARAVCATGSVDFKIVQDEHRCARAARAAAKPQVVAALGVRSIVG